MKTLQINDNWRIESNGEGSTLIFAEKRIRNKGTEKEEEFLYEDPFYYNTVYSCLCAFLNKSMENAADVKDCIETVNTTFQKLKDLKWN